MDQFLYHIPTKVVFGPGTEAQAGEEVRAAGGSKVLVLYGGSSAVKSGLLDRVTGSLERAGLPYACKGGVQPNPTLGFVHETIGEMAGKGIDFLLAVGGGSVIDAAKAVAFGLAEPELEVWDLFAGKRKPAAALPVGAVVTIAAAGSETSDSAVITKEDTREKRGVSTPLNRPRFAILDPELTYTLPSRQTACGTADILMHTLERYFSSGRYGATTDAIAEALLRTVLHFGPVALARPDDYEARSELMWCGSLCHNGLTSLGRPNDFPVHQLGHELTAQYGVPHGESLTIMWGEWARAVWETDPARFARLARNVFGVTQAEDRAAALAGIEAAEAWFRSLGLATSFSTSEFGVVDEAALAVLALGCSRGKSRSIGVFHPLDYDGVLEVYRAANH